ncbi:MAG: hypothetical protein K2O56_02520, partial [Muribaculaceae bacterium]|nr:hypothetical protein [Muribaculaceae bacterium]
IVVDYALEGGITGKVTVPFTNTDESDNETPVNIVRNNLYRVVLGDGDPIRPGADVEVKIIDEPWEVIDLPVVVGKPEPGEPGITQAEANAALLVNKFARTPVSSTFELIDFVQTAEINKLKFASLADNSIVGDGYAMRYTDVESNGLFDEGWTTTIDGQAYRVPTVGEMFEFLPVNTNGLTNNPSTTPNVGDLKGFVASLYSLPAEYSIYGTVTDNMVIYSYDDTPSQLRYVAYIISGVTFKEEDGSSYPVDYSGEQARIYRITRDFGSNTYILDVIALRTVNLPQLLPYDSNELGINPELLTSFFDSTEKLTFRTKAAMDGSQLGIGNPVLLFSAKLSDGKSYMPSLSMRNNWSNLSVTGSFMDTAPYLDRFVCFLIKAD